MKDFRWFRSEPFESQLSINPDVNPRNPGSPAGNLAPSRTHSSLGFNSLVLGTAGLSLLALAVIACSRQAHQPAAAAVNVSQPVLAPPPPVNVAPPSQPVIQAETKPVAKKAARKRPEKVVYKNDVYGVSFQYPRRYALKTGDEAILDWFGAQPAGMNFVDGGGVAVAAVELPRGLYPGTDYRDGFFTVSVNRNLSEAQCSQFAVVDNNDSDEEPVAPRNVNFGGQIYSQTEAFAGKAFEQAYSRYYHLYRNGACYEMALALETAGYGAVDGITPVDRDEVFHKLDGILSSVRLRPEEKLPEVKTAEGKPAELKSGDGISAETKPVQSNADEANAIDNAPTNSAAASPAPAVAVPAADVPASQADNGGSH